MLVEIEAEPVTERWRIMIVVGEVLGRYGQGRERHAAEKSDAGGERNHCFVNPEVDSVLCLFTAWIIS